MKVYALYDKVGECYLEDLILAKTDRDAVRKCLMNVIKNFNLNDIDLVIVGEFDIGGHTDFDLQGVEKKVINWNLYKFPENKAEALAPLEMSEEFKKTLEQAKLDQIFKAHGYIIMAMRFIFKVFLKVFTKKIKKKVTKGGNAMTSKTQTIITTVVGAIVTAIGTISVVINPTFGAFFVGIAGTLNEVVNVITKAFIKEQLNESLLKHRPIESDAVGIAGPET